MLTVIKDAAVAADEALEGGRGGPAAVVEAAAGAAHASVRRTPELLPVLREAGVVDAGGLGVAVVLDGLYACVTGRRSRFPKRRGRCRPTSRRSTPRKRPGVTAPSSSSTGFDGDAEEFEEHIYASGRSVFVVADDDVVKVHLHTQDPGEALSYAGGFGRLAGVKVDDMEAQVRSREHGAGRCRQPDLGVVAASRGEGNRDSSSRWARW